MHPTAKPVALIMDAIKDCSRSKGIILDPFSGSGTTIIACERTRRIARAMELDPAYVDLAVRRWEALTGEVARLTGSGATLDEAAAERGVPCPHFSFERK
jgi:DNA modification methylase